MEWIDLPWPDLSPSVRVDILGIYAYRKPALRIAVGDTAIAACTAAAFAEVGWASAHDGEYLVAAPTGQMARHILDVDRRPQPHALELGLLLGYPECCARTTAAIGEERIDDHATRLGDHCDREQAHHLDPRGYQAGVALVSYVACSPHCSRAMRHANAACAYIAQTTASTAVDQEPWITWRRTLNSVLVNGHGAGG
ncbi:hypothetical protein OG884_14135 [Streptosporangium sp. NBC_01755]|uniref:hypothetical protein n=1 Tax=unclassified Streptosporangium TaxID=2632669 RepID=UPI002DD86A2A|nr:MULTISPECIES: hypothetical protein [unclassified Streptosporangium]WSA25628.1 hypothetical protein OIE13_32730 [Streptosporangium sp. NBC_01810]WSD02982.1 hypothetical protein OG884_14135 [Streptosporangium sp. NBC_01755]